MSEIYERTLPFTLERAEDDGDGLTLSGYAAVFNTPTRIQDHHGEYDEVIAPGAFKRTIQARKPVLMFEHGKHPLIGSMPIGAIQELREDDAGLFVKARLFDNWMIEPLRAAISERAIEGMSFRFSIPEGKQTWSKRQGDVDLRTVRETKTYELGPVVFPAYPTTSIALRSLSMLLPGELSVVERNDADDLGSTLTAHLDDTASTGTSDELAGDARTSDEPAVDDSASQPLVQKYDHSREGRAKRLRQIEMLNKGIGRNSHG
jgi:HK97 family phage prohead protease